MANQLCAHDIRRVSVEKETLWCRFCDAVWDLRTADEPKPMANQRFAWLEEYFKGLRFNESHHIGLGDIRLTVGQQEDIVKRLRATDEPSDALDKAWVRIGYLEEGMRHIYDEADRSRNVREIALLALKNGDPLTCPEARATDEPRAVCKQPDPSCAHEWTDTAWCMKCHGTYDLYDPQAAEETTVARGDDNG